MKNNSKTIFIPICILGCALQPHAIDLQQYRYIQHLYLHSNFIKASFLPLHLQHRFSEYTYTISYPNKHLKSIIP